ncbi:unnamed protein product [Schistocephalus solidus]|uniref:C2H2-type domain-containing protein n=1 Tax=Schistocephalus solidus TaxID=70667 RepID=A0A183T5F4_SCHSO|nr:unnamed protein product [Schistocephalus solidus]
MRPTGSPPPRAKRAARKSQAARINIANAQALPKCPRCQRTFRSRICLFRHIQFQHKNNPTISTSATPTSYPTTTTTQPLITIASMSRRPQSLIPSYLPPSTDHGDEHQLPHYRHLSGHPRIPVTCYLPHRHQYQRWGLVTSLSLLRSLIHLTHRPGRSLANPSHRDWRTSAWSTNS